MRMGGCDRIPPIPAPHVKVTQEQRHPILSASADILHDVLHIRSRGRGPNVDDTYPDGGGTGADVQEDGHGHIPDGIQVLITTTTDFK